MGDFLKSNYGHPTLKEYEEQIKKEEKQMKKENWFELIKAMIMAGLGYLAGIFL